MASRWKPGLRRPCFRFALPAVPCQASTSNNTPYLPMACGSWSISLWTKARPRPSPSSITGNRRPRNESHGARNRRLGLEVATGDSKLGDGDHQTHGAASPTPPDVIYGIKPIVLPTNFSQEYLVYRIYRLSLPLYKRSNRKAK